MPKSKKRSRSPDREWDSRTSGLGLPQYDATKDRYCPYTHSKKFQYLKKRIERNEELERQRRLDNFNKCTLSKSNSVETLNTSALTDSSLILSAESSPIKKSNTGKYLSKSNSITFGSTNSSITWQTSDATDPASELEILKCIVLREGYISKLRELSKSKDTIKNDFVDFIDLTRLVTVETIEFIKKWRRNQPKVHPFIWNGINYLLKIASDLDFLDNFEHVRTWFNFSLKRNPFMISSNLDNRISTPRFTYERESAERLKHSMIINDNTYLANGGGDLSPNPEFLEMGGNVDEENKNSNVSIHGTQVQVTKKQGNKLSNPYEKPIVNDPTVNKALAKVAASARNAQQYITGLSVKVKNDYVIPSQVGDLDMLRIRECERLILNEEQTFGQHCRDEKDQLVLSLSKVGTNKKRKAGIENDLEFNTNTQQDIEYFPASPVSAEEEPQPKESKRSKIGTEGTKPPLTLESPGEQPISFLYPNKSKSLDSKTSVKPAFNKKKKLAKVDLDILKTKEANKMLEEELSRMAQELIDDEQVNKY
jgi:hypothetical protein